MKNFHDVEWTPEAVSRMWAYYAQNPAYEGTYFSRHSGGYILNYIRRHLDLSGKKVLDFGCGPGHFIERLVPVLGKDGARFGLDFSQESIEEARQRLAGRVAPENLQAISKLPSHYAMASVDVLLAIEVIEHLDDEQLRHMLEECGRLLKTGGYLVLTTPNCEDLDATKMACPECGCVFHRWQHVRRWDADLLVKRLAAFEFETVRVEATQFEPWHKRLIFWIKRLCGRPVVRPHVVYIGRKR